MGRFYRIIFLFILIPAFATAQTMDCEQTLALATEEYNAGHFYNVPSVLNDCLTKSNRDQRQRAFLLLTQTYLLLDDPIGAQRSYLEVLAANPEFIPDEQLHAIDIVYLSKRFTATPKFSWFVGAGSNVTPVSMIRDNKVAANEEDSYKWKPGYNAGVGGEYSYNDNLKIRIEANFINTSFELFTTGHFNFNNSADKLTFIERETWVNLPAYVAYSDNVGRYRPYGYAGYSVSKLLTAKANLAIQNVKNLDGESGSNPAESPDIDFMMRRNPINHSVIVGAGMKYKIGLDFVFVEARYSAGLKNFTKEERSLSDPDEDHTTVEHVNNTVPIYAYGYRDNYVRLNNIALTFGFVRPLYKPREVKRARTGGVLRKMKRSK